MISTGNFEERFEKWFRWLLSVDEAWLMEYLNDKVPGDWTKSFRFLMNFGDYIHIDGEVISAYEEKRRRWENRGGKI